MLKIVQEHRKDGMEKRMVLRIPYHDYNPEEILCDKTDGGNWILASAKVYMNDKVIYKGNINSFDLRDLYGIATKSIEQIYFDYDTQRYPEAVANWLEQFEAKTVSNLTQAMLLLCHEIDVEKLQALWIRDKFQEHQLSDAFVKLILPELKQGLSDIVMRNHLDINVSSLIELEAYTEVLLEYNRQRMERETQEQAYSFME